MQMQRYVSAGLAFKKAAGEGGFVIPIMAIASSSETECVRVYPWNSRSHVLACLFAVTLFLTVFRDVAWITSSSEP